MPVCKNKKLKVSMYMVFSQRKCLECSPWGQIHVWGDICSTRFLHHRSCFAPSRSTFWAYADSVHQSRKLLYGSVHHWSFTPGSTNIRSISANLDPPTDISDCWKSNMSAADAALLQQMLHCKPFPVRRHVHSGNFWA